LDEQPFADAGESHEQLRPTTVLLVRHTEVHNPNKVLYGRLPRFGLSDKGKEQARHTARALSSEPVTRIFSSPMLRARQTAASLAEHFPGVPVRLSWLLAEIGSSWQGSPLDSFGPDFTVYEHPRIAQDEREHHVAARMRRFLRTMCRRYPGETVVGVSHGDPIKFAVLCAQGWPATGMTARQEDPARGSISRFEFATLTSPPTVTYHDPETGRLLKEGWERLGSFDDLQPGAMREIKAGHRELLVARTQGGALHVVSARCPHMRAHLADGVLNESVVTCALHGAQFNLETGKTERESQCPALTPAFGPADKESRTIETGSIHRYRLQEREGAVWVRTGW